jgi:hypothetical protein
MCFRTGTNSDKLVDATVRFRNRSLTVSPPKAAEANELSRIAIHDLCQVVVNALCPFVRFLVVQDIRTEGNAVAQYRNINLHVLHVAELLFHVEDLGECGHG